MVDTSISVKLKRVNSAGSCLNILIRSTPNVNVVVAPGVSVGFVR